MIYDCTCEYICADIFTYLPLIYYIYTCIYMLFDFRLLFLQFFSKNGLATITTTDPTKQSVIGRNAGVSYGDSKKMNSMYNCAGEFA